MATNLVIATAAWMLASCLAGPLQAQAPPGRISGTVVEARTRAPLVAVLVEVQSTRQQALSGADGRFEIADVPAGQQTVVVSVVGFGLVRRRVVVEADRTTELAIPVAEGASTYVEEVTVAASPFREAEPGAPSQAVLGSRELLALRGVLADDPFRAVQTLPGVATSDDFKGEFSVRGLGPQHIGISVDGIDSPLLFHTVRAVNDTGSLALINSDILQEAALLAGPHPQKLGSHLGARVDLATRDGTRSRFASRLMVSGSAATGVFEGPIGSEKRGSWLVAARQSYVDWLLARVDPTIDGRFGFTDVHGGVTYDLTSRQQLKVNLIGGRMQLHDRDDYLALNALERGGSQTAIVNLRWRFTPSPRAVVSQQVYALRNTYTNKVSDGRVREQGWDRDVTWRGSADWRPTPAHAFELGAQAQTLRAQRVEQRFTSPNTTVPLVDANVGARSAAGYVAYRWTRSDRVVLSPGVRLEHFGLINQTIASPWLLTEWRFYRDTRLRAGASVQHQPPTLDDSLLSRRDDVLVAERARGVEIGVEQRFGNTWRANVTTYHRLDRDRLRLKNAEFRIVNGGLVRPDDAYVDNVLSGIARGVDLTVERRSVNGWTGWMSYAWGKAVVTDESRTINGAGTPIPPETYPAEYDQRHTVNVYGAYRWSGRTSVSARFRYGSNFPINAYVRPEADRWALTVDRGRTRLPEYARLDVRADRAFPLGKRRLTLFVEVLNALNRDNFRARTASINTRTREVTGLTERVFPLLPSAGILVEF